MPTLRRPTHLLRDRRGAVAVEFAVTGMGLMFFIFAILNLGLLGLDLGALQHGVQQTARAASVAAAADLAASPAVACPTSSAIQTLFNGYVSPPLKASTVTLSYAGSPWTSNDGTFPGSYIVLTATYNWAPIGFAGFMHGITLKLSGIGFVLGSGANAAC